MSSENGVLFAKGQSELRLLPEMADRHGLIAGATGTGKTVSLKVLCEKFSSIGVPVFLSDIKGDLSGTCKPGVSSAKTGERIQSLGLEGFCFDKFPVTFWDVFAEQGHPVRTTVSEMGSLLFSKLLNLNEVQSGVLNIVFKIADDSGMLLIDLKDLRAMLRHVGDHASEFTTDYGTISKQSIGAIQRGLLTLEEQGGERFFGEPSLDIRDFMKTDSSGKGVVNILAADIPETVLGQLGNRVQHALRAFTPKDQFAVKTAAQTFRANPAFSVETAITELGVGEALVSFLDDKGIPGIVERAYVLPPQSQIGPVTPEERDSIIRQSFEYGKYEEIIDRVSAFETLQQMEQQEEAARKAEEERLAYEKQRKQAEAANRNYDNTGYGWNNSYGAGYGNGNGYNTGYSNASRYNDGYGSGYGYDNYHPRPAARRRSSSNTLMNSAAKSAMSSIGRTVGRELVRGILGSLLRK